MHLLKTSQSLKKIQKDQIRTILELTKWNQRQIDGQIESLGKFINDKFSIVVFALEGDKIIGFISAQFYSWNCLGQVHGLAIHPDYRKQGIASSLLKEVELFMRNNRARGIYVDTPVNNLGGCVFYEKNGFKKAYIMPEYYDKNLDGVTFLKFLE